MYKMNHINFLSPGVAAQSAIWPWYSSDYHSMASPPKEVALGALWELQGPLRQAGGNAFMLVKAAENLVAGQLVTKCNSTHQQVASTVTAAGSSTQTIVWAAGSLTVNAEVGNLIYIANTTSSGGGFVLREILSNTATTITFSTRDYFLPQTTQYDQNALLLTPTNGDVAVIIRPYVVGVNTATTVPCGVALGTVTVSSGPYTIIQVAGEALVLGVGNGTALAVGKPAVGSAAGVAIGSAADAANLFVGAGSIIPRVAYSSAGPTLQPMSVNFLGNL